MIQLYKRLLAAGAAAALLVLVVGGVASATGPVGVTPATYTNTSMLPGTSVTVPKTVQTSEIPPNPDLVFLADTTGSMGGAIGNVQTNATNVMNSVLAAQPTSNFGAASYKDRSDADRHQQLECGRRVRHARGRPVRARGDRQRHRVAARFEPDHRLVRRCTRSRSHRADERHDARNDDRCADRAERPRDRHQRRQPRR